MNRLNLLVGVVSVFAICLFATGAARTVQEKDELEKRFELLEQRVQKLESILFTTAQLSVYEAEKRLEEAKFRLKESKDLHVRGFINQIQLEQDRFAVQQAQAELELARTEDRGQQIIGEIDMLEAERAVDVAQQQLQYTQTLVDRGYATRQALQQAEQNVIQLKKRLELAKTKAKAAAELQKLKQDK